METADNEWNFINSEPRTIVVWLEPWAEEFEVLAGSTVLLRSTSGCEIGELEWTEDHLTVWASAKTVEVFIDGVLQDSASASIPVPDSLTREMLNLVFAEQPGARLGGAHTEPKERVLLKKRIVGWLHL